MPSTHYKTSPTIRNLKRNLTLRFGLLLSLFLVLYGVSFAFTKSAVDTKEYDSVIVNLAGRQRMLAQKYATEINLVLVGLAVSDWELALEKKKIAAQTADAFEKTHSAFTKGGDVFISVPREESVYIPRIESRAVQEHLGHVEIRWAELKRVAVMAIRSDVKSLAHNKYVTQIQASASETVREMDHVTFQLQVESEARLRRIKTLQIIMIGVGVGLFVGITVFVYLKIVTPLDRSGQEIHSRNKQLSAEIAERKQVGIKLKTAMKEALRANKAKSVFLSSMSHELRTPLNSILGFTQLMTSDTDEPLSESQNEDMEHILKSGNHLLELINEVLDLSGIESGKVQISSENIEIDTAINEAITTVEPIAQENSITINYPPKYGGQYIRADNTRLKQVLINLLSNAIKYNNDGGSVSIWIEFPTDNMLRVNIEDTGPGIAKENHDSMFEPFNRLGAESLNIEGTGVGLTITKKLVEMMDGSIGVESEVGKGTKFYVDFMKVGSPVLITGKKVEAEAEKYDVEITKRYTMLYVEDNPANLELVENILQRRPGISLLTAPEAQLGIELARSHKPDIILMDINLPGMDGYEALKLLKSFDQTKEIPVIALSANAMPKDIKRGQAAGFKDYITKPINVNKFLEVVDGVLTTP